MAIEDFIEARIAEDEAIAKAAGGDRWDYDPSEQVANGEVYRPDSTRKHTYRNSFSGREIISTEFAYVTCDHEGLSASVDAVEGAHIARQDPARVLRQCAALRATARVLVDGGCSWCDDDARKDFDPVLRGIAAIWSDHPDYQSEWATE